MNLSEAKDFARNKTLKATALLLVILVLLLFLGETKGDLANGILFFIQAIFNIHALAVLIITFGLTILFAGLAGREVILEKQNAVLIAIKYSLLLSFANCLYAFVIILFRQNDFSMHTATTLLSNFIL